MPVCKDCHLKIHHEDGFHDRLEPDRKRPDKYGNMGRADVLKTCREDGSTCELVPKVDEEGRTFKKCIHCERLFYEGRLVDWGEYDDGILVGDI